MPTKAPTPTMKQKSAFRGEVRAAAVALAKEIGTVKAAQRLGVVTRTIQWWCSGTWPSYNAALRHAPTLGIKAPV